MFKHLSSLCFFWWWCWGANPEPQTKQMLSYWATVLDKELTFEIDIWSHHLSAFCTLMASNHTWINSNSLTCHMKASKILLFIWGQSYLLFQALTMMLHWASLGSSQAVSNVPKVPPLWKLPVSTNDPTVSRHFPSLLMSNSVILWLMPLSFSRLQCRN